MSEFMGNVYGQYDAKPQGFVPGGMSLHNMMLPHGPDAEAFEKATTAELKPVKLDRDHGLHVRDPLPAAADRLRRARGAAAGRLRRALAPGAGLAAILSRTLGSGLNAGLAVTTGLVVGDFIFLGVAMAGLSAIAAAIGPCSRS